MHSATRSLSQKLPFALGWRTHFNFCVANLPEAVSEPEPILRKSRQFTVFEFVKKEEADAVASDYHTPQSCLLTQFHVVFAFTSNLTVVSRISQQVVHNISLAPLQVKDIFFDLLLGRTLLVTKEAPLLMATFENEVVDAWRQFLAKGDIEEAFRYQ